MPRLAAIGLAAALLGACGDGGSDAAVAVRVFRFTPATVTVESGTTVTWTSEDEILHTVTSGRPREGGVPGVTDPEPARPDGRFTGDLDGRGSRFSFTFEEPGTYGYYCDVHTGMSGRVVVK